MFSLLKEKFEHLFPFFIENHNSCTTANGSKNEPISTERNPWQDDLYRLASSRRNISEPDESSLTEMDASTEHNQVVKATKSSELKAPEDIIGRDAKKWWAQAVATWNPRDGKNIDSIEKLRRPRQARWFR